MHKVPLKASTSVEDCHQWTVSQSKVNLQQSDFFFFKHGSDFSDTAIPAILPHLGTLTSMKEIKKACRSLTFTSC